MGLRTRRDPSRRPWGRPWAGTVSCAHSRPPCRARTRILANTPAKALKLPRHKAASLSVVDSWCVEGRLRWRDVSNRRGSLALSRCALS